jgi:hypothetical protein
MLFGSCTAIDFCAGYVHGDHPFFVLPFCTFEFRFGPFDSALPDRAPFRQCCLFLATLAFTASLFFLIS